MTKRRKSEKLPACQSKEEAVQLLGRFAVLDAEVAARNARVDEAIASLRAQAAELNAPAEAEIKAIFMAVKPWWAVAGAEITDGKRKSWELAGCLIGHRIGNPTLVFPKPEDIAVAKLEAYAIEGFLRVVKEINKPELIRLLSTPEDRLSEESRETAAGLRVDGFSVKQTETFFIDRLPPREESSETLADPQAAQVLA